MAKKNYSISKRGANTQKYYPIFYSYKTKTKKSHMGPSSGKRDDKDGLDSKRLGPSLGKGDDKEVLDELDWKRLGMYPFNLKDGEECSESQAIDYANCERMTDDEWRQFLRDSNPFYDEYEMKESETSLS